MLSLLANRADLCSAIQSGCVVSGHKKSPNVVSVKAW
jgi:hypothetical protein